jgi:putative glutamine amidotransferase
MNTAATSPRASATPPIIGISCDVIELPAASPTLPLRVKIDCGLAYAQRITRAGGLPIYLAPDPALIPSYLMLCAGVVLTGGDDPSMEPFGVATHPKAKPIHPLRQQFELALLNALAQTPAIPTLGICLGMQLMCLHAGGTLDQHLPDTTATHELHRLTTHRVPAPPADSAYANAFHAGTVLSNHRQAITSVGPALRILARADDGIIEAVASESRPFYLGVQWHPERTDDPATGQAVFDALVRSCTPRLSLPL